MRDIIVRYTRYNGGIYATQKQVTYIGFSLRNGLRVVFTDFWNQKIYLIYTSTNQYNKLEDWWNTTKDEYFIGCKYKEFIKVLQYDVIKRIRRHKEYRICPMINNTLTTNQYE